MRASSSASIASLNASAATVSEVSRSSINMRICRSRAAHPRVNAPPAAPLVKAPRKIATKPRETKPHPPVCLKMVLRMADLLDRRPACPPRLGGEGKGSQSALAGAAALAGRALVLLRGRADVAVARGGAAHVLLGLAQIFL